MFQLGLIIGGGTAQIQKNIIAERGLEMPREPKPGKSSDAGHQTAGLAQHKQGADWWISDFRKTSKCCATPFRGVLPTSARSTTFENVQSGAIR